MIGTFDNLVEVSAVAVDADERPDARLGPTCIQLHVAFVIHGGDGDEALGSIDVDVDAVGQGRCCHQTSAWATKKSRTTSRHHQHARIFTRPDREADKPTAEHSARRHGPVFKSKGFGRYGWLDKIVATALAPAVGQKFGRLRATRQVAREPDPDFAEAGRGGR